MTSASELFYQRRSRLGRLTNVDVGGGDLDPSSSFDRVFPHNYARRHREPHHHSRDRDRRDFDGCDPLRRHPHVRHSCNRLSALSERSSTRLDQGTSPFVPSTSTITETQSSISTPRRPGNERLPSAVLLARARLLERLQGVTISANRRSSRTAPGIYNREHSIGDEFRVVDGGDWGAGISVGWSSEGPSFTDLNFQTERQESCRDKPPGLTPEALECLQSEIYIIPEKGAEKQVSGLSCDCSICLESFREGDKLIRLPCEHRFHSACLDPWIRTCGDCPYCRRDIVKVGRQ